MDARELDFDLPDELIAQTPPTERDGARMALLERGRGLVRHARVLDLPSSIRPSLFVVNDTKVLPARLFARKATQGRVELLLIEPAGPGDTNATRWNALARGAKNLKLGQELAVEGAPLTATIRALREWGEVEVELTPGEGLSVRDAIGRAGHIPLPPYIRRSDDADDAQRYQTIFAASEGSVAAPTAGLHFSPRLLEAMGKAGHTIARVTLHVGPGTFAPLRADDLRDHRMHTERYDVPVETTLAIARAKAEGRPVVAVGTTACRTLESAANEDGSVRSGASSTNIFIYPPYAFRVIDALFTNFHLPRSTLLALVMAFGGTDEVRAAYAECVRERYRFFSYGDAMLVRRPGDAP